jgi:hypothetical protein
MRNLLITVISILSLVSLARGEGAQIVVKLPDSMHAKSGNATIRAMKVDSPGTVGKSNEVIFEKLTSDTPYDLSITLTDGRVLQGIDLGWLDEEPPNKEAGPLTDDDRNEMMKIMNGVKSFYDHQDILLLRGDHDRATALVQLVRDREFYADKGGEIIWRIELYYFKFQYGGWEKVMQANKVLRRERFHSKAEYQQATEKIRWTPELGGVSVPKDKSSVTIEISDKPPATQPKKSEEEPQTDTDEHR